MYYTTLHNAVKVNKKHEILNSIYYIKEHRTSSQVFVYKKIIIFLSMVSFYVMRRVVIRRERLFDGSVIFIYKG